MSPVPTKQSKMSPGERIVASLDNMSMVLSRGIELREKEQEKTAHSLQKRAMKVVGELFSDFTEEKKNFLYYAMLVIEDDNQAKTFLALPLTHRKHWLEEKIDSAL